MRKITTIFLFLCMVSGALAQEIKIYPVQLSDPKDFGGRVNCIFQDKTGFIWIGKETGLFRYDGNELKAFRHDPVNTASIAANNILTIIEDTKNNLWIGTKGGGLNFYNRSTGRFNHYLHDEKIPTSISYNEVYVIKPDNKGNLWIGTDGGGLNFFNAETQQFNIIRHVRQSTTGLQSDKILRMVDAGKGQYWVCTWGGGLHLFQPVTKNITHIGDGTRYAKSNIYSVKEVSPGILWMATWGQGLVAYDLKKNLFSTIIQPSVIPYFRDIEVGRNGEIWCATSAGLLNFKSKDANYQLIKSAIVDFENVSRLYIDRSNTLWLGCENGTIGKINFIRKKFSTIPSSYSFGNKPVNAVISDKDNGQVYFSSENNLIQLDPSLQRYKIHRLTVADVYSLLEMPERNSLLCATVNGIFIFDKSNGRFSKLRFENNTSPELLNRQLWTVAIGELNTYWIGALGAAYQIGYNKNTQAWKVLRIYYTGVGESLSVSHYPSCFLTDSKKNFWIGTWGGGLNQLKTGEQQFVNIDNSPADVKSLSDNFVECMVSDKQGNVFVGTHSGLNQYDSKTSSFRRYTLSNGLSSDWIAALVADSKNRIWLSSQNGISSISKNGKIIKNYDFNDGLPANSFRPRSVAIDKTGNMYFGSVRGLVWFHPDSIKDNGFMPAPVLVGLKVNDEEVAVSETSLLKQNIELTNDICLENNQSTFSLQMAALSYSNSKRNRIKYKLIGYDDDWRMAGSDQTAVYSEIPSGNYTFSFMVSNEDGIWNKKVKSINIHISSPPWLSFWTVMLCLFIGLLIMYLFYKKNKSVAQIIDSKIIRRRIHLAIEPSTVEATPADVQFLQKALTIVEENMSNPNFGVEELCDKLFMSRPQVYRKINLIAGVSVSEFMKEIRLKRAAQLILQKPGTISEIAYQVGFNDPKYFSKCFKQQFGVSPVHYSQKENLSGD